MLKEQIIELVNNIPANEQSIPCLYDWEADTIRIDDGTKKPTEAKYKLSSREMYYKNISDNGLFLIVKTELDQIKQRHQVQWIPASDRDLYIDHEEDIFRYKNEGAALAASRDECKLIKFVNNYGRPCKMYQDYETNYLILWDYDDDYEGERWSPNCKFKKMLRPDEYRSELFNDSDVI